MTRTDPREGTRRPCSSPTACASRSSWPSSRWRPSSQDAQLTTRDDRRDASGQGERKCRYGVRAAGREEAVYHCDERSLTTGTSRERLYADGRYEETAEGSYRYERSCLIGAWREAGVAGTGAPLDGTRVGARGGYAELRRDCSPTPCPLAADTFVTAWAWVVVGGERIEWREDIPIERMFPLTCVMSRNRCARVSA